VQSHGTGHQSENPPCIIKYRDNFAVYYRFPPLCLNEYGSIENL
jgi:hypothetical protein